MQDIFIQSKVIDIFPKFKMAAAAILDFRSLSIWLFRRVDSVVFVFCTKFGSNICVTIQGLACGANLWFDGFPYPVNLLLSRGPGERESRVPESEAEADKGMYCLNKLVMVAVTALTRFWSVPWSCVQYLCIV